jgi:hypothetical protein
MGSAKAGKQRCSSLAFYRFNTQRRLKWIGVLAEKSISKI